MSKVTCKLLGHRHYNIWASCGSQFVSRDYCLRCGIEFSEVRLYEAAS